mmetsp:Transcript_17916/g.27861  ORF Transcript_17916/g.27861 Transcript_17916/m.27861 type:complete len:240 (+) Transcript_17916:703-1422(+)
MSSKWCHHGKMRHVMKRCRSHTVRIHMSCVWRGKHARSRHIGHVHIDELMLLLFVVCHCVTGARALFHGNFPRGARVCRAHGEFGAFWIFDLSSSIDELLGSHKVFAVDAFAVGATHDRRLKTLTIAFQAAALLTLAAQTVLCAGIRCLLLIDKSFLECIRVLGAGLLDRLISLRPRIWRILAIRTVAPIAKPQHGKTITIQFETLRPLAIARIRPTFARTLIGIGIRIRIRIRIGIFE